MSPPSLGLKSKTGKKEEARSKLSYCLLHAALLLGLLSSPDHGNDSSSGMSVDFQWATRYYISEDARM
jgi:hypothetical protein